MNRIGLFAASAVVCAAIFCPPLASSHDATAPSEAEHHDARIQLSDRQIEAGNFSVQHVGRGALSQRITVSGAIVPSGDHIAKVSVRLLGTVAELRKRLGDPVKEGEVVAVIESREVADAKSEYLAARLAFDLQQTLFTRSKSLFDSKVLSENDYLRARTAFEDVRIKLEVARQKLFALGLAEDQIAALPQQPVATLRLQELRAPITGRIAERRVDLGSLVGREGQESELFVIVDLDVVWADLSIPVADLNAVREGQSITLRSGNDAEPIPATIKFVSPLLDKETRLARVIASIDNSSHALRPGSFVTAEIPLRTTAASVKVPKTALQTIKDNAVVFVRTAEGFEPRQITTDREDQQSIEVVSGLSAGERIATANTFILKAELGKSDAQHQH
ncbi:efflux RND transporter periplasmic adaptor subunit [Bradyrhizobium sp. SYSU BS000235]|uniref:efflux RND transporter periplasmic adaptor subunit n=1 Tax=Bradyrhizobium sp. SYSU BS000235 TaxID=3411332 RepID=UPI003C7951F0